MLNNKRCTSLSMLVTSALLLTMSSPTIYAQSNIQVENLPAWIAQIVNSDPSVSDHGLTYYNTPDAVKSHMLKRLRDDYERASKQDRKFIVMVEALGGMYEYVALLEWEDFDTIQRIHRIFGWKYRDLQKEKAEGGKTTFDIEP